MKIKEILIVKNKKIIKKEKRSVIENIKVED